MEATSYIVHAVLKPTKTKTAGCVRIANRNGLAQAVLDRLARLSPSSKRSLLRPGPKWFPGFYSPSSHCFIKKFTSPGLYSVKVCS